MKFVFNTTTIDKKLYERAIRVFVYYTLNKKYRENIEVLKGWTITIHNNDNVSSVANFDGQRGIGGVTGKGKVDLYINDVNNDMIFMENFLMISHELCHMIGIILGWNERVPLRNADWSGHKAGTVLNRYVQEVHDRHVEGRLWTMTLWTLSRFWKKYHLRVLDIRDLV